MSRSYKKYAKGHRHLSEKKDKITCSKCKRRANKVILKDFEYGDDSKIFINSEEAYSVSWHGQKEGCRSYQDIESARKYVRDAISEAITSLTTTYYHNTNSYSYDSEGLLCFKKIKTEVKKKPWSKVKKWMFHTWNEKILSVLEIEKPNDLYKVKDENIEKAAQLLFKNWSLMK